MGLGNAILDRRARKKLEKAIKNVDLDKAKKAIEMGARHVDYSQVHYSPFGGGSRLVTQDPVKMAEWSNWGSGDRQDLAQALEQPLPEAPEVSVWDAVIGDNGPFAQKIAEWTHRRLSKQLGQAIMDKDPDAIARALDAGATRVNMQQVHPIERVMIKRVQDPVELAQEMGLSEETIDMLRRRLDPQAQTEAGPSMR